MTLTATIIPPTRIEVTIDPNGRHYSITPSAVRIGTNPSPPSLGVSVHPATVEVGYGYPIARDIVGVDPYEGEFSVTPSTERQTLATEGKWMRHDVVVDPIPSNYGLITWNGSVLTVS